MSEVDGFKFCDLSALTIAAFKDSNSAQLHYYSACYQVFIVSGTIITLHSNSCMLKDWNQCLAVALLTNARQWNILLLQQVNARLTSELWHKDKQNCNCFITYSLYTKLAAKENTRYLSASRCASFLYVCSSTMSSSYLKIYHSTELCSSVQLHTITAMCSQKWLKQLCYQSVFRRLLCTAICRWSQRYKVRLSIKKTGYRATWM